MGEGRREKAIEAEGTVRAEGINQIAGIGGHEGNKEAGVCEIAYKHLHHLLASWLAEAVWQESDRSTLRG